MRNVVNFKEIEKHLDAWKREVSALPLTLLFIEQNLRNYLYRQATIVEDFDFPLIAEASEDGTFKKILAKGGPFHRVLLTERLKEQLTTLIHQVVILEATKALTHPLEVTSLNLSFPEAKEEVLGERIVYINKTYKLVQILTPDALLREGKNMNNCLGVHVKMEPTNKNVSFYSLRLVETGKSLVSLKTSYPLILEARERFDKVCENPDYKQALRESLTKVHGQEPVTVGFLNSDQVFIVLPILGFSLLADFWAFKYLNFPGVSSWVLHTKEFNFSAILVSVLGLVLVGLLFIINAVIAELLFKAKNIKQNKILFKIKKMVCYDF